MVSGGVVRAGQWVFLSTLEGRGLGENYTERYTSHFKSSSSDPSWRPAPPTRDMLEAGVVLPGQRVSLSARGAFDEATIEVQG